MDLLLQTFDLGFEVFLFPGVVPAHHGESFIIQPTGYIVLVNADEKAVKLSQPLFSLCQPFLMQRYEHDFSAGIIAAVNHDGDSDSTGAVTGNILGAINGYDSIGAKWKNHLKLMDVLLEMSDDLCRGCLMSEYAPLLRSGLGKEVYQCAVERINLL